MNAQKMKLVHKSLKAYASILLCLQQNFDGVVVAVEGSVVQRSPAARVGLVHVAAHPEEERDERRLKR